MRVWKPCLQDSLDISKHNAPVTFATSSLDTLEKVIITGSRDGILKLWKKEETSGLLELKLSFQAHEGSVNCGCFKTLSSTTFMTGGDDNAIYTWQIMDRKDGFFVRKLAHLKVEYPVVCIVSSQSPGEFFFSTWGGDVTSYRESGGRKRLYLESEKASPDVKMWVTCLTFDPDSSYMLLMGSTQSRMHALAMRTGVREATQQATIQVDTEEVDQGCHPDRILPNFVNCCAVHKDVQEDGSVVTAIFAGDSRGQIIISKGHPTDHFTQKVGSSQKH